MNRPSHLLAVAALCANACSDASRFAAGLTLATDAPEYVARGSGGAGPLREYTFPVIARFRNGADRPAYISRCWSRPWYDVVAASAARGAAPPGYATGCVLMQFADAKVPAGGERTDTLWLSWPGARDGVTRRPVGEGVAGRFRLVYQVLACPAETPCPVQGVAVRSNEFAVRVGP